LCANTLFLKDNKNGLQLTETDSINFINFLAHKAHSLNLAIGLKNAGAIIDSVLPVIDFSVNEQCVEFGECSDFSPFINATKPVFHIEYPDEVSSSVSQNFCKDSGSAEGAAGFSTVLKKLDLDGWVKYCDGSIANTTTSSAAQG
jgi:hypothetical protein